VTRYGRSEGLGVIASRREGGRMGAKPSEGGDEGAWDEIGPVVRRVYGILTSNGVPGDGEQRAVWRKADEGSMQAQVDKTSGIGRWGRRWAQGGSSQAVAERAR